METDFLVQINGSYYLKLLYGNRTHTFTGAFIGSHNNQ